MNIRSTAVTILVMALFVGSFQSCTTSKSLMKDGLVYSSSGMHHDAVNAFKASLQRNNSNAEARAGLKTSAQRVLDAKLDEFTRANMLSDDREAVYAFKEGEAFQRGIKKYGVDLFVPNHYYSSYAESEDRFLSHLYEEGKTLLGDDHFEQAKTKFKEIAEIKPNYRDVSMLLDESVIEPIYRDAVMKLEQESYREAYRLYEQVQRVNPNYKDLSDGMQAALEGGQFVLAMLPFENSSMEPQIESRIQAYALNGLLETKNPFLKIVDRQHLDQIIAEQDFSVSGAINDASAVELGNLTGAQAILVGQLIDFRVEEPRVVSQKVRAYEAYQELVKDEEGKENKVVKYRPVQYVQHSRRNSVYVSFHLKMLDLETSEVLVSEVIERQLGDEVNWSSYKGTTRNLVPEREGEPYTKRSAVTALKQQFSGRQELADINQLSNQSLQEISDVIANKVNLYLQ